MKYRMNININLEIFCGTNLLTSISMTAKYVAILFQKGLPIDVQQIIIIDVRKQEL